MFCLAWPFHIINNPTVKTIKHGDEITGENMLFTCYVIYVIYTLVHILCAFRHKASNSLSDAMQ